MTRGGAELTRGGHIPGRRAGLEWAMAGHRHPRAMIFAPPLIGGSAAHQVRLYRILIQNGYDLFSFSFSGHGASEGRFSLTASIRDTRRALFHAAETARRKKIPLFAVGTSYSAIPLLGAGATQTPPFSKLVLVNPLTRLDPLAIVRSFLCFCGKRKTQLSSGDALSKRLHAYLDLIFPKIDKGVDGFGALRRERARVFRIVAELLFQNPLSGVALAGTPTLCLYGRNDEVLRIFHPDLEKDYEPAVRRICPATRFRALPGGHFFRCQKVRNVLLESLLSFISERE